MHYFDHEKLDVYQATIEFVVNIEAIVNQFPKGRAYGSPFFGNASGHANVHINERARAKLLKFY